MEEVAQEGPRMTGQSGAQEQEPQGKMSAAGAAPEGIHPVGDGPDTITQCGS